MEAAVISAVSLFFFSRERGERRAAQAPIKFAGSARKHAAETRGVVFIGRVCLDVTAGSVFDAQRAPPARRGVERHAVFFLFFFSHYSSCVRARVSARAVTLRQVETPEQCSS